MKKYNSFLGAFFSGDNGQGGYNAAYGKSALAKLYTSQDPAEQQAAAEGLARVDPESAAKWQQEQAKVSQERLERQARMFASITDMGQKGKLYATMLPEIRKNGWADAPDIYTSDLDNAITAWAGTGSAQDGDTRWIQTVDENGKPVWAAANNRGIKPTKFGLPTSYKLEDDEATGKKWRFNTKTGQLEPTDDVYVAPAPTPTIQGADNFKQAFTGLASKHGAQITSITRTPEENRRVGGVANSYHLTSQAGDFVVPQQNKAQFMADARAMGLEAIDEGDHIHVEPPSRGAPPPRPASAGYVGLSAAEKARVQAEEKARVDLAYAAPTAAATAEGKARVEAQYGPQTAGATTAAQEDAKRRTQAIADAPNVVAVADQSLAIIDKAINHPGRAAATGASAVLPWDYAAGSAGKDFMAVQKQLEGQAFLQAFERLKGGGQITEIEGQKATQAMARLDRAQSEGEYLQALKDLREVFVAARGRAMAKAGYSAPPPSLRNPASAGQPVRITSKKEYDSLPSGTDYIGPDGKPARKK